MSRPVDSWYFVYWSFSPHYVMYSGWVGDQVTLNLFYFILFFFEYILIVIK